MTKEYWEDPKIPEYFDVTDDYVKDLSFYRALAKSNTTFLELGAGTGRVAIELAKVGAHVTGIERSAAMLQQAKKKVAGASFDGQLSFVKADMQDFTLESVDFDVAYIAEYSFAYLYDIDSQLQCLNTIRNHLKTNGILVIHMFQPNPIYFGNLHVGGGIGGAIVEDTGYLPLDNGNNLLVSSTTSYRRSIQELHSHVIYEEIAQDGSTSKHVLALRTHVYYPDELKLLLRMSGYRIEAIYGDFDRSPLNDDSWELIAVARA